MDEDIVENIEWIRFGAMHEIHERVQDVKGHHRDLQKRYAQHSERIEVLWRSLPPQRKEVLVRAGADKGHVLAHANDKSPEFGDACNLMGEWNLRNLVKAGPKFLLDMLKHRATTTLTHQFHHGFGVNDDGTSAHGLRFTKGDADIVHQRLFHSVRLHQYPVGRQFIVFSEQEWGECYHFTDLSAMEPALAAMTSSIEAGELLLPTVGVRVVERVVRLLHRLVLLTEAILDVESEVSHHVPKPISSVAETIASMAVNYKARKHTIEELQFNSIEWQAYLEDHLHLLRTESTYLEVATRDHWTSQQEFVADERGAVLSSAAMDQNISLAFFDVVQNAHVDYMTWVYITRLLDLLRGAQNSDKAWKALLYQEIANVVNWIFQRARGQLKRHVQTGTGNRYFKRIAGVYDEGAARVKTKVNLDALVVSDPLAHSLLQLCRTDNTAQKSVLWISKIDGLHRQHPEEREKMLSREVDALGDLAMIASYAQQLAASMPLPSPSQKATRTFLSKLAEISEEMNKIRAAVDLSEYLTPMSELAKPHNAAKASDALDLAVTKRSGFSMKNVYQQCIEGSLEELHSLRQERAAQLQLLPSPLPPLASSSSSLYIEEAEAAKKSKRKSKKKTRPADAGQAADLLATEAPASEDPEPEAPKTITVDKSAHDLFTVLFSRTEARHSLKWSEFLSAMGSLSFTITPEWGSMVLFVPPTSLAPLTPITLHAPHTDRLEGQKQLQIRRRLWKKYGWNETTFELA